MDKTFVQLENKNWVHRPIWKVIANSVLRTIQKFSTNPVVIWSICETEKGVPVKCLGYKLRKINHGVIGEVLNGR